MGNNLGGVNLLNNVHFPHHVQLGRYAAIHATQELDDSFESDWRKVIVTYTVDGSTCVLDLETHPSDDQLTFTLRDDIMSGNGVRFYIFKADKDLLRLAGFECIGIISVNMKLIKATETYNAWGGVTKTNVIFYGSGSKGVLLVMEEKTKKGDMKPYKVTVAHYYAASSGNVFTQNKIDIGLSMVLNIQWSRNDFDVTVEGPVQHPSSALFYMFEHVYKTGIWKPMACPHCANLRHSSGNFWQSESEDSDGLPPARLLGPKPRATSVVSNDGAVRGNNNGNLSVGKFINYGGRYFK